MWTVLQSFCSAAGAHAIATAAKQSCDAGTAGPLVRRQRDREPRTVGSRQSDHSSAPTASRQVVGLDSVAGVGGQLAHASVIEPAR